MAINRVDYPANLTDQSDFSEHGELIETRYLDQAYSPLQVVSGDIPQGVTFQVGGVVYRADSDTAVSGTASDYVRIVPDGATATAEYVTDLTGVSWSKQYNGYYDGSGNLYIFDEGKALAAGEITAVFGRYLMQQANGDVQVGRDVNVKRNANVDGNVDVDGGISAGESTFSGTVNAPNVNTGHGNNELYPMNQAVRTTDDVEFSTVEARGMDTFGGFLRSAGSTETNLPIGSYVLVDQPANRSLNVTQDIYAGTGSGYAVSGTNKLAGTWRVSGQVGSVLLARRVS